MENRNGTPSLSVISGLLLNGTIDKNLNEYPTETFESTIENLLEKNSELTKQLEKALMKISRLRKQRSLLLDAIVKVNKGDEADKDEQDTENDSDLTGDDIDSDIQSSAEEEEEEPAIMTKKSAASKRDLSGFSAPALVKRRRIQSQQPRRQRVNKPIEVPKDEDGNYIFPVQLGRSLLLSLGKIIPNENFYNQNYIFPVGYSIQRSYKSMVNEDAFTTYTCSIDKDTTDKAMFCIQAEDAPEIVIQKNTPTAAWSEVLRRSNELRKKEFKNTVSGPEYYGLSFATIKKMIQELPGAIECAGYQWADL